MERKDFWDLRPRSQKRKLKQIVKSASDSPCPSLNNTCSAVEDVSLPTQPTDSGIDKSNESNAEIFYDAEEFPDNDPNHKLFKLGNICAANSSLFGIDQGSEPYSGSHSVLVRNECFGEKMELDQQNGDERPLLDFHPNSLVMPDGDVIGEKSVESLPPNDETEDLFDSLFCNDYGDEPDGRTLFDESEEDELDSGDESGIEADLPEGRFDTDEEEKETSGKKFKFSYQVFLTMLTAWALKYYVPRSGLDALLKILRLVPGLGSLPKCAKTLLPNIKNISSQIRKIGETGKYFHFGLEKSLRKVLSNTPGLVIIEVCLLVSVDGLPIFKSSPSELWPILCTIQNIPSLLNTVMPIGLFFSTVKPDSATFLKEFVTEVSRLIENGIIVNGKKVAVRVQGFCADAPGRALIMGTVGHNGFWSCIRCKVKGIWSHGRSHFNSLTAEARTNDDFLDRVDTKFQKKTTPLVNIPGVHFVRSFCLDVMHLVYLGITKTILKILMVGGKARCGHKISVHAKKAISEKLISLKRLMPLEFVRKPRSLDELLRYKATELRTFLLYTGPSVLKNYLSPSKYENFLALHVAMRIVLDPMMKNNLNNPKYLKRIEYADQLFKYFIQTFEREYEDYFITHNFHSLSHLTDDVLFFGSLQDCSAFKFENYLAFFKTLVKQKGHVLEQIAHRLSQMYENDLLFKKSDLRSEPQFHRRKKANLEGDEYERISYKNITITTFKPNNVVQLKDGRIMEVKNIYCNSGKKLYQFSGLRFKKENAFVSPCLSSHLNIYKLGDVSAVKEKFALNDILHKCVLLPHEEKNERFKDKIDRFTVSYPLLHFSSD